ncbi:AfsA-related hotdog domain-containing protein [Streptomyces sp. NPDC006012]|uniref:AfsA-related hotdog domain-containing protein n=1 Tax=Streptomyces sp. NPDC006012 TaxID=3364739 RepID=UPI00367E13DB
MPGKFVFVVGDNLADGSDTDDLMPLSRLDLLLEETLPDSLPVLVPGQGIEVHERETIRAKLRRRGLPESMLMDVPLPAPLRPCEVHKHRPENVLIAGLHKVEDDLFRATLRISDKQEMILDHTTGSHVTGMVITEAVRQISVAVAERDLLTPSGTARRFIMNSLQTVFHKFLLPLPTRLEYRLEELRRKGPDRLRFRGRCDLLQADVLAASGSTDIVVMDEKRADRIEADHIRETTRALTELHAEEHGLTKHPAV